MLVIKSLLEPAPHQITIHTLPTYWDGKAWGKGLAWAATYKSIDDLPAKLGSSLLDRNSDPLTYMTKEGTAIATVEQVITKEDVLHSVPCYYIHIDLHVASPKEKIAILAQANLAIPSLTQGCEVLHSHIEVKLSDGKPSSITTTPLILEPAKPGPLEQAILDKLKPK